MCRNLSERWQRPTRLPGGAPERLTPLVDRKTGALVPLVPLAEKLRAASRFAVETMRNDLFVPSVVPQPEPKGPRLVFDESAEAPVPASSSATTAPTPAPVPAPTPAPSAGDVLQEYVPVQFRERLAALLRQQMQAAASGDDASYERCVAATATLRAEIDEARNAAA
jgi:hypothetical protein